MEVKDFINNSKIFINIGVKGFLFICYFLYQFVLIIGAISAIILLYKQYPLIAINGFLVIEPIIIISIKALKIFYLIILFSLSIYAICNLNKILDRISKRRRIRRRIAKRRFIREVAREIKKKMPIPKISSGRVWK